MCLYQEVYGQQGNWRDINSAKDFDYCEPLFPQKYFDL